jgi:hypothetical protein
MKSEKYWELRIHLTNGTILNCVDEYSKLHAILEQYETQDSDSYISFRAMCNSGDRADIEICARRDDIMAITLAHF